MIRSLFQKKRQPPDLTGEPVHDIMEILLRIETHLAEISERSKHVDKLERRLQGIETALKQI
jgi:hypothetical protein